MSDQISKSQEDEIRHFVRERYGRVAEEKVAVNPSACCGGETAADDCCGPASGNVVQLDQVARLYEDPDVATLPTEVTDLSLGCGDPVTLASLRPGQTVLDLGSGGGIDCFLAGRKVGSTGKVIGVDMTPAMLERARANRDRVGASNVEFRLGEIEHLPVADNSVDVVISNCVINLSPDKPQVFREAYRVLRPGGWLAVSDIVTDGPLPQMLKDNLSAWAGCVSGAMEVSDYIAAIEAAGFADVELRPVYWDEELLDEAVDQLEPELAQQIKEARTEGKTLLVDAVAGEMVTVDTPADGEPLDLRHAIFSAKIRARKAENES
jgi:SAM-dependent methyltransferase